MPTLDLSTDKICKALAKRAKTQDFLGALIDDHDQIQYDVFPELNLHVSPSKDVTAYELLRLGVGVRPRMHRAHRYNIALKLAAAQLQFYSTHWIHPSWTLDNIRFSQSPTHDVNYNIPYILTDFEAEAMRKTPANSTRDQSFWTLGVVFLELCFGMLLEDHSLLADPKFARNPQDPFERQAVTYEWAKDVELEGGSDYASAVKWCLQQSPISGDDTDWRKDFAQSVLQPLQRCSATLNAAN